MNVLHRRCLPFGALLGVAVLVASNVLALSTIDLVASGDWSVTVTASDLPSGAGSDLPDTDTSPADVALLTISGTTGPGDSWQITVRMETASWPSEMTLWLRRTGSGSGGSVSGGDGFQALGTDDAAFLTGSDDVSEIPLQLQVTGRSVWVPPGSYQATVTLTVVDL